MMVRDSDHTLEGVAMSYGVNVVEAMVMAPTDQQKTMEGIKAAGATYVRMSVPWSYIEPTQGSWQWAALDQAVKVITTAGLKPLMVLEHPKPQTGFWFFASDAPWATPAEYGKFCTQVVKRYPQVTDYELWNEPNLIGWWKPIDPVTFAPYVKAGYSAAKTANPAASVALGGLAAAIDGSTFSWWPFGYFKVSADTRTYLTALYANGCGGHFDAVAYHPYVGDPYTFKPLEPVPTAPSIVGIGQLHDIMAKNGDGLKEIWPTEWGFSTTQMTEDQQAKWLVEQYNSMKTYTYLTHSCVFNWRDLTADKTDANSNYGLVRQDYTAKPALAAMQTAWRS